MSRIFTSRRPSRLPAAVLRAADVADVAAGVRLARDEGWSITVRSGGHSWAVWSLREDALLIDMAEFTTVEYDEHTQLLGIGPAANGSDIDRALTRHERFFPVPHFPTVGMGGFLLQGGMGWNCRGWGWAAESIESMNVVTADGDLVLCSESENADLFWAARGSGPGFFGVVTGFSLRTRPRYPALKQTTLVFRSQVAAEVLTWFDEIRHDLSSSVDLSAVAATTPRDGRSVVIIDGVTFDGESSSLAPLGACPFREKAVDATIARNVELADLFAAQRQTSPQGHRYFVDNAFLDSSTAGLIASLAPAFDDLPTSRTFTVLGDLGQQSVPRPDMAFSLKTDLYFAAYVIGQAPSTDSTCQSWLSSTMDRIAPHSVGCYLGDSDLAVRRDRIMSDDAWSRFQKIRTNRDPDGKFTGFLGEPAQ